MQDDSRGAKGAAQRHIRLRSGCRGLRSVLRAGPASAPLLVLVLLLPPTRVGATLRWERTYGGPSDAGEAVRQTRDGGYIVAAESNTKGDWLIKTDSLGDTMWTRSFGLSCNQAPYALQLTRDGGFIFAGDWFDSVTYDWMFVMKTDSMGDSLWAYGYRPDTTPAEAWDVEPTRDGGWVMVGDCVVSSGPMAGLLRPWSGLTAWVTWSGSAPTVEPGTKSPR